MSILRRGWASAPRGPESSAISLITEAFSRRESVLFDDLLDLLPDFFIIAGVVSLPFLEGSACSFIFLALCCKRGVNATLLFPMRAWRRVLGCMLCVFWLCLHFAIHDRPL